MAKKLIIHIGPHKTGTTALQYFLFKKQDALKKAGVLYPSTDLRDWQAHHRLAMALKGREDRKNGDRPDRDLETAWIAAEARQSSAGTIVISSEEFFSTKTENIKYLADKFSDFDIRAVFYARRQDDFLVASYAQKIKMATNDFNPPIYDFLEAPMSISRDIDLFSCVSRWADVIGKDKIDARLYGGGIDICSDFLTCIGSDRALASTNEARVNSSPTLEALEAMRTVKLDYFDLETRQKVLGKLDRHYASGRSARKLLSTADRRRILEFFRRSNENLFAEHFGTHNLFAPEALLGNDDVPRETANIDIAAALAEITRRQWRSTAGDMLKRTWRFVTTWPSVIAKS